MLKKALRRSGRLIAVTALVTALLGSTAGALGDQTPVPGTVRLHDCKAVAVTRDASVNYTLNTSRGAYASSATAHGDVSVLLCYDLQATVGATVNVVVHAGASAEGDAAAFAAAASDPAAAEGDTEHVCVSAGVDLAAGASASVSVTGGVSVGVVANASASGATSLTEATAQGTAVGRVLDVPVEEHEGEGDGANEFATTRVCVDSKGEATAS